LYRDFLRVWQVGEISPSQFELTYVNVLPKDEGWTKNTEIGRILPLLGSLAGWSIADRVTALDFGTILDVGGIEGAINVRLNQGVRVADKHPVFRLELRAYKSAPEMSLNDLPAWFDRAHAQITDVFTSVTSEYARDELWQKH
jgi:uncharacterized protein (TIGR04255 family)